MRRISGWSRPDLREAAGLTKKTMTGRSPFDSPHAGWFFTEVQRQPRFAHHPLCSCYDNHLVRVVGHAICLGCLCLGCGILLGTLGLAFLYATSADSLLFTSVLTGITAGVVLYLPALIQPFCQWKWFKIASRLSLGVSIAVLWNTAAFVLPNSTTGYGLRLLFLLVFVSVFKLTLKYRSRHTPNPMQSCNRGCYPFCEGNRDRLDQIVSELAQRTSPDDPLIPFAKELIQSGCDDLAVAARPIRSNDE